MYNSLFTSGVTSSINSGVKEIVGLIKDAGRVTGYKLSDGSSLSREEGMALARQGGIFGVGVSANNGGEYLKLV